jgi:phage FluMu protein Com
METEDVIVICPWCKTLNSIPERLFKEAQTSIVRTAEEEVNRKQHFQGLASDIKEKVLDLFETPEDPNDWLDVRCNNNADTELGTHSFQVNIRTREVKK